MFDVLIDRPALQMFTIYVTGLYCSRSVGMGIGWAVSRGPGREVTCCGG